MTQEQKAKAYDKAKYIMKEYLESGNAGVIAENTIKKAFPELAESEDEKIRKWLIRTLKSLNSSPVQIDGAYEMMLPAIAWLEKQSTPQVRTGLEWVNTIDDACDKRYSEEYAHGEYCHEQSFKWGFQEGVDWLEKQGEQKPVISDDALREGIAHFGITQYQIDNWLKKYVDLEKQDEQKPTDKTEPKFKVGDWVVYYKYDEKDVDKIVKFDDDKVSFESGEWLYINQLNEDCRLWTIQDAKEGDIIFSNDGHGSDSIEIIKSISDKRIDFWFCLSSKNNFKDCYYEVFDGIIPYTNFASREDATPATKEQRDLLFSKMKEAGYKWDSHTNKIIYKL